MAALSAQERAFLDENPFVGVLTTLRPDGSPHSTVVWVDILADGTLSFNTARGRAKDVHLQRDPRVSLVVVDPAETHRFVAITGRVAETTEDGADAQADKLAHKYLGVDAYPFRAPGEVRISLRIDVARVESQGVDD